MKFKLIINKDDDEEIIAKVHSASKLTAEIENIVYIDRGYENVVEKFTALGADIKRVPIIDGAVALKQA